MLAALRVALAWLLLPQPLGRAARVFDLDNDSALAQVDGGCCTIHTWSEDIREWLERARDLDKCCPNYGSIFGWHGARNCPEKMADVLASANRGAKEADGGKSGAKVIVTPEYVVKVIDKDESVQQRRLMVRLTGIQSADVLSLMVPTCREVKVYPGKDSEPKYMIVMPNVMLHGMQGAHITFDLKGNWDYGKRLADWHDSTLKDGNFNVIFPAGMMAARASFKGEIVEDDGRTFLGSLLRDTYNLERLELMDYSLFVDMVDLCPQEVIVTSKEDFVAIAGGRLMRLSQFKKHTALTGNTRGWRPVYKNADQEYIYYWAEFGEWHIGFDPGDARRGLGAKSKAGCPDEARGWQVHDGDRWDYGRNGVQLKGSDIISTATRVQQNNADKPLLYLEANEMRFVMSVGIIDMFMHGQDRGFWNTVGGAITLSECMPHDIDPIPAEEYRVRFMRMFGYKDPMFSDGKHCGSCLGSRRRQSYTYIRTRYQRTQYWKKNCSWGS